MELVDQINKEKVIIENLEKSTEYIGKLLYENKKILIIASGDPLFYGIGRHVVNTFGENNVKILPHIGSIQYAMSLINESYEDLYVVSLHGRPIKGFAQKIFNRNKAIIFTDRINTPSAIARYLVDFNILNYSMYVFENLGYGNQKIKSIEIPDAVNENFLDPNIVYLKRRNLIRNNYSDDNFIKINNNITKKEIRDISVSEMEIQENDIIWDIGSGSGSISIQACRLNPMGKVFSVEKNVDSYKNIILNMKKFHCDLDVIHGHAPEVLTDLPDPDIVFIGGSSGKIEDILDISFKRLKSGGRMIINTATIDNFMRSVHYFKKIEKSIEIIQANISRNRDIKNGIMMAPLHQIYIIRVVK